VSQVVVRTEICDMVLHREQRSKARKRHRCTSCDGPIPPGATYTRHGVLERADGRWHTYKVCGRCEELFYWNLDQGAYACETSFTDPVEDFFDSYTKGDLPMLARSAMPRDLANWLARLCGTTLARLEKGEE